MDAEYQLLTLPEEHLGLYVHVPCCVRKCAYCDFASGPLPSALVDRYLEGVTREAARLAAMLPRPVSSVFIGGGTPTALAPAQLRRLWAAVDLLPRQADAEVSLEANPGTLGEAMLAVLAELPLTRLSLGVQSFHPEELAVLGRIHTPEEAEAAARAAHALGVQLNLDLMYRLPGGTAVRWGETLDRALALAPDHLSLYALIVEEGTPLAERVEAGELALPAEEEELAMEALAEARLPAAGFAYYEVSNAARPGRHCRHNLGYWLGRDYLGLGPAAVSTLGALRWRHTADAAIYADRATNGQSVVEYSERLSAPARLLERTMLGLRLRAGFDLPAAERACGATLDAVAGEAVRAVIADGLLARDGDVLRLTPAGRPVANQVTARLMAGAG